MHWTGRAFVALMVAVAVLARTSAGHAAAGPDPPRPGLVDEDVLLFREIPTVYAASRYAQKPAEAPSAVSIVTGAEIRRYGHRTLADILRSVRGFHVTYDRNYSYAGVRGFGRPGDYNTRLLLLVDGHRLNDDIYDSALIGTEFPLDVDLIERVEIIRGPSSSLYGANAFFGVINVVTRRGRDFKGIETSGEAGSFRAFEGRLGGGGRFGSGVEAVLSASLGESRGDDRFYREFADPATNNGVAAGIDGDRWRSAFTTLSFADLTLQGLYGTRTKEIPTASYGTIFNDPREETVDTRGYVDLEYERDFSDRSSVLARMFLDHYMYRGVYPYDYPPVTLNKDYGKGDWAGAEAKYVRGLFRMHKVTAGAEYRYNFRQDQGNFDEDPYVSYFRDERSSRSWALYLQDEVRLPGGLILNAGVRHDYYYTFGGSTNPRIALIWTPLEQTTLKLLYGTAFRAPSAYELYYSGGGTKSNPDLAPETIRTYELVLEQYAGERVLLTAAGFHYAIDDLIDQTTDPADNTIVFRNLDAVEAWGLELEADGRWESGLEGRASFTCQRTEDRRTGRILTNSPRHLARLNLAVPLRGDRFSAGIEEQFTSRRTTLGGGKAGGFAVTNLTLRARGLLPGLSVSGSVYNLFDRRYGDPGGEEHLQDVLEQDGRTYRVKVTWAFR